jgi:DNA mismatch repair protein MutS2
VERLYADRAAEDAVLRSVDAEGAVLDTASKELKRIRGRLRGAHSRIVRQMEAYMRSLPERFVVADASVTVREGRYVLPVRREGRSEVGGIVHDESQSGATLFVEPPMAMELMNQLRDLERDEAREIRRILGALSDSLYPLRDALEGSLDALVDFDSLHARARTALAWNASVPEFGEAGSEGMRIVRGRHPLLLESLGEGIVPFDLEMEPGERVLVVTGPNTGGKSVFLKATGLIATLAQSGVVPPVDEGTLLPVFESFFADIGDEQSIAQNLSTFSAHLGNLSEIVSQADWRSLVLIDEMGTGTDPAEGAALSRAVLEELASRGALAVVSSHLGELKRLDGEGTGIVNASLQFDDERMQPTYQLVKGRPGRSFGLAIARRLGFPEGVLQRAEGYREGDETSMEELLARLERREREAEAKVLDLDVQQARASRLRDEMESREHVLREAERSAQERAREEARKLLLKARAEVEEAILELRVAAEGGEDLDEAGHKARRRVEESVRAAAPKPQQRSRSADVRAPRVGERVRVHATGAKGTLVEVRSERAVVEAGALRLEIPLADVEPLERAADSTPATPRGTWTGPTDGQVKLEVDLRGLRVDEMDLELSRALDQAVFEDLAELRIIHGKGTGALRQRVGEVLKLDPRVQSFRMGGVTEGGAGVTVAIFRGASS